VKISKFEDETHEILGSMSKPKTDLTLINPEYI
jgi:hypothetical protein